MFTDDGVRPDDGTRADDRGGMHYRAGVNRDAAAVARPRIHDHAHQQVCFRGDVLADERLAMCARERTPARPQRHLEPKAIAGHDGQPELRVVNAAQIRARGRARAGGLRQENRRHLREGLDHQHARHQRSAGKVPLEKLFADGDVLVRDDPTPGIVLRDRIHQRRRVAVAQAIEDFGDVD